MIANIERTKLHSGQIMSRQSCFHGAVEAMTNQDQA